MILSIVFLFVLNNVELSNENTVKESNLNLSTLISIIFLECFNDVVKLSLTYVFNLTPFYQTFHLVRNLKIWSHLFCTINQTIDNMYRITKK